MIAYTIGNTSSYDAAIIADPYNVTKVGRNESESDGDGGWIWKTIEDALAFINSTAFLKVDWGDGKSRDPKKFSVYGLTINDWDTDTYKSEKDSQYHLIKDAKVHVVVY